MQASFKTYFRFFGILSVFQTFAFAALAAPTFGAEFNFTNFEVRHGQAQASDVNSEVSESYRDAFMLEVMKVCGDCKVVTTENSYGVKTYKIVYPDKWYFVIATDPAVIEVQTKPSTAKQIENRLERIQKHIFDAAKAVGLDPASKVMGTEWAGSHIHVGATSALGEGREAVLALRNFMVDFSNHPELATGVFTNDHSNAPPIAELPVMQRELFKAVIADVDSGKIRSINTFANRVRKDVYSVTPSGWYPPTKYQAFNVNRIGNNQFALNEQTFEIRAMRGQDSAMDFLIEAKLLDARLEHLSKMKVPVAVSIPSREMSEEKKAESFYRFVIETGLDFAPYKRFLTSQQSAALANIAKRVRTTPACKNILY